MNDLEEHSFWKSVINFGQLFSDNIVFRLACAVSGISLFTFLRSVIAAFGGIRLDEFQALYYMTGNDNMISGIIDLFCGGAAAVVLAFMAASLFGICSAAKKEDIAKAEKNLNYAKTALVIMLIFTVFAVVFALCSVGTIEYYYKTVSQIYKNIENNADDLFKKTVFIGTMTLMAEIAAMKFFWDMGRVINGKREERKINILDMIIIMVLSIETAYIVVDNLINIFRFDYSLSGQNAVRPAMFIVTFFMMLSAYLAILFFIQMIFTHLFIYDSGDDFDEEFFFEPDEEFEKRVFENTPLNLGTESYELSFEIAHTEYPEREAMNDG